MERIPQAYYYSMQSYFRKMYMQPICHLDHLVYDLPHYASEVLVGRRYLHAEELGQGKDENNRIGMVSVVNGIEWD